MTDQTPQDTPPAETAVDPEMDALLDTTATDPQTLAILTRINDHHGKLENLLAKLNAHFQHHDETANRVINQ